MHGRVNFAPCFTASNIGDTAMKVTWYIERFKENMVHKNTQGGGGRFRLSAHVLEMHRSAPIQTDADYTLTSVYGNKLYYFNIKNVVFQYFQSSETSFIGILDHENIGLYILLYSIRHSIRPVVFTIF